MAGSLKKQLALDANVLLDLAEGKDFVQEFREEFQVRDYELLVMPTAAAELNILRACLKTRVWVVQATGLCRPATRRTERVGRPYATLTGFFDPSSLSFRSASRRPERAGRPHYPLFKQALSLYCGEQQ